MKNDLPGLLGRHRHVNKASEILKKDVALATKCQHYLKEKDQECIGIMEQGNLIGLCLICTWFRKWKTWV